MKLNKKNRRNVNLVIRIQTLIFALLFVIYSVRMGYLAMSNDIIVKGSTGKNYTIDEFQDARNITTIDISSTRGTIYDGNLNPLAETLSSYTVIAYLEESRTTKATSPKHVVDVEGTAEALAPLLGRSVESLVELMSRDLYQIQLATNINQINKESIEELNLYGIDFVEGQKRFYPYSRFASYEIGYAKINDDVMTGEMGLEMYFNDQLTGIDGSYSYEKDLFGYRIINGYENRVEPQDGYDVYTTINRNVQIFVETALTDSIKKYDPELIMMVVADAKTGQILASSSRPSFDPNIRNIESYLNPVVEYPFEPGSTMKIYTYAAAIDTGVYEPDATFLSGEYQVFDDTVGDWKREGWGYITYDEGFALSSNVGVAHLVEDYLSKETLEEYFLRFGFGSDTGVQLPRENDGKIAFKYPIEVVTAGFGQGITTTAYQHIQALTAIANDGKMYAPYIVEKVVNPNDETLVYEMTDNYVGQVIKSDTAVQMRDLMDDVVNGDWSTGGWFAVDGYDVIGKTGTAQIPNPNGAGYLTGVNDNIYSFAGMFPKDDPQIIIYGASIQPKVGTLNKLSISEPVVSVIENVGKLFNIVSTNSVNIEGITTDFEMGLYINQSVDDVLYELSEYVNEVIILGAGSTVIEQNPKEYSTISAYERVILKTESETYTLPNMQGWSKKDVLSLVNMLDIPYTFNGSGYVVSQSFEANTMIDEIDELVIEFESFEQTIDNSSSNE